MTVATNLQTRQQLAEYIAINAGSMIMDLFHKDIKSTEKAKNDFVTELDKSIESMALKTILQSFPDDSFYGEENIGIEGKNEYLWIVDPIDGTNNFIRGLPLCGFQLALLKNDEPIYSYIYRPFTQEVFTATKGQGAFYKNILTGEESPVRTSDKQLQEAMVIYDAHVGRSTNASTEVLLKLADYVSATRVLGVAVFDIPAIAAGVAEILVTGIAKRYDVAAGMLLLEEAGGEIYNLKGSPPEIDDEFMIFSNKVVKKDLMMHLAKEVGHE
jgi:myo-inositol-1(or 4)-monophosphatase